MICLLLLVGCENNADTPVASPAQTTSSDTRTPAVYVGSERCRSCHQDEYARWQMSHHAQAMAVPTRATMLGNFDNASFEHFNVRSRFRLSDDRYSVEVGPSESREDTTKTEIHEITHAFGVFPLQQYLVLAPDGRYQPYEVAADVRDPQQARWISLSPDAPLAPGSTLHWQGHMQTWNFMCADCHTTDLRKGYDQATNTYDTQWAEIGVGCEACHGPGSNHLAWSDVPTHDASFGFNYEPGDGLAMDVCARCHSRRSQFAEGFAPGDSWLNYYAPALLEPQLYLADGQVNDEVFVYGSFAQSRMHQAGVVCADCHDAHGGTLLVPAGQLPVTPNMSISDLGETRNALCVRCHQSNPPDRFPTLQSKDYENSDHHMHAKQSAGATCTACHMPGKVFMGVDERHDHSFRVPRPDLSVTLGTRNACNDCHVDRSPQWAADVVAGHFPTPRESGFAETFHRARRGDWRVQGELAGIAMNPETYPAIVRATALSMLSASQALSGATLASSSAALELGLQDVDGLVRVGALRGLSNSNYSWRGVKAIELLSDPLLAVRQQAMETAMSSISTLTEAHGDTLRDALSEYQRSTRFNEDRADAQVNYASLLIALGAVEAAREAYMQALRLDPDWSGALVGMAELNRLTGSDVSSEPLYVRALQSEPAQEVLGPVYLSFGLWLVRQGRVDEALVQLELAANHGQGPQAEYVHAIALHSSGDTPAALGALRRIHAAYEFHLDTLVALTTILRDSGELVEARRYATRLVELAPHHTGFRHLLVGLESTE